MNEINNKNDKYDNLSTARDFLVHPYDLNDSKIMVAVEKLMSRNIDYADIYFQYNKSESWSLEEGKVKTGSFNIDQGFGVRNIFKEKTAFAYSDDISLSSLNDSIEAVNSITKSGNSYKVNLCKKNEFSNLYLPFDPLASIENKEKIELLKKLESYSFLKDSRVKSVICNLAGKYEVILVINNEGKVCADVRPLVRLSLQVIVEEKGRREQGSSGGGGRFLYDYYDEQILKTYAEQAVNQAIVNLNADHAPAGKMDVVLGSGWPGVLLHEAIGHGLEGDFNRKRTSAFTDKIGQKVAADGVTVVDDGTIQKRRGSLSIDDEGNQTKNNVLIENGILKKYMQDTLNAKLMNVNVTGNGRRQSYAHLPMPRMTNTYMLNGNMEKEEILSSVKKGIYAANFGGGQVDIVSGKFVFSASEAYIIENGKIKQPVKGATLIGNGPDVLTRVSMIGNDMALDSGIGTCGKDGQSVPVGVGQPSLRVNGLIVGGTSA